MINENTKTLIMLRLKRAKDSLNSAVLLLNADFCKDASIFSYYTILHAMRAMLIADGFDSKKQTEIITGFGKNYIKNNIFPKDFSVMIGETYDMMVSCEYDAFFIIAKEDVALQIENAKTILAAIEAYIATLID